MKTPSHIMSLEFSCLDELWRRAGPRREPIDDLNQEIMGYMSAPGTKPIQKGRNHTKIPEIPQYVFIREGNVMGVYPTYEYLFVRPLLGGPIPSLVLDACHADGSYAYDSEQDHLVVLYKGNSKISVYDMKTGLFLRLLFVEGLAINGEKTNLVCVDDMILMTTLNGKTVAFNTISLRGEGVHRRAHAWWHFKVSSTMDFAPALTYAHGKVKMARVDSKTHSIIITQFLLGKGPRLPVSAKREEVIPFQDCEVKNIWFIGEQWVCISHCEDGMGWLSVVDKSQQTSIMVGHSYSHHALEGPDDTIVVVYSDKGKKSCSGFVMTYFF